MENNSPESDVPDWLRDIQVRSWEPEIILSSIVTIGLLRLPQWIEQQQRAYLARTDVLEIGNYVPILEVAIYWLAFGFIAHLVLRGVWVGMVGLSFVFPEGIRREAIRYAPQFERHLQGIAPIEQRILRLEKICSSVFAIAFLLFMCIVGTAAFFVTLVNIPAVLYTVIEDFLDDYTVLLGVGLGLFLLLVAILGAIYLIDFLTLGLIKRVKWLSRIYYPVYRFFNVITLSFLYRDIYYILITNFNRWKILAAILVYFAITVFVLYGEINDFSDSYDDPTLAVQAGNYNNLNGANVGAVNATIQSDIIHDDVLRLFVIHRKDTEVRCNTQAGQDDIPNSVPDLECLGKFYQVLIQDSLYASPDWYYHRDPSNQEQGVLAWIDVAGLPRGKHVLTVRTPVQQHYAVIPFFKK